MRLLRSRYGIQIILTEDFHVNRRVATRTASHRCPIYSHGESMANTRL
jgi:hypothetical protein